MAKVTLKIQINLKYDYYLKIGKVLLFCTTNNI